MAKKMNKWMITGIITGVAAIGTALYFVFRSKEVSDSSGSGAGSGEGTSGGGSGSGSGNSVWDNLSNLGQAAASQIGSGSGAGSGTGKVYTASLISEKIGGSIESLVINIAYPRPLVSENTLAKGKYVTLSNFGKYNGDYRIEKIFVDQSNAVGAIYLSSLKVTKNTTNSTEFQNIGKITVRF